MLMKTMEAVVLTGRLGQASASGFEEESTKAPSIGLDRRSVVYRWLFCMCCC
jgi:hypothetical protein